jgi:hypothetical protein
MKIKDQRLSALISVISVPFAAKIGQADHAAAIVGQAEVERFGQGIPVAS